jgi:hypothetical protein
MAEESNVSGKTTEHILLNAVSVLIRTVPRSVKVRKKREKKKKKRKKKVIITYFY